MWVAKDVVGHLAINLTKKVSLIYLGYRYRRREWSKGRPLYMAMT